MSSFLSRRSVIEGSIAASLSAMWTGRTGRSEVSDPFEQVPPGSLSVKDFGAKGDGSSDDASAFQAAVAAAARVNGVVVVPTTLAKYIIGSPITLAPNTTIRGAAGDGPTLRLAGAAETMFTFVGRSEAEVLSSTLSHLTLESGSSGHAVAVRVRNFRDLFLRHVRITHFEVGAWADWGIGIHLYDCNLVKNTRGLQVGGAGGAGGIRGGDRRTDAFMDTVVVDACGFSQNALDINDMGSNRSLGGIVIRDCSFYEWYMGPVPGKYLYIRIANRKGLTLYGNWFEGGQPSRTCVYLGNYDHDGNVTGICNGAAIFGNHFLQTGQKDAVGVDVVRCEAATVFGNCFEFAAGNSPIRLADAVGSSTVGQNAYLTYPDRSDYARPILSSSGKHQILDPRLTTKLGNELQVGGRVVSGLVALQYGSAIATDAASGNYFVIVAKDGKPFTVLDPSKVTAGQQVVYDIRNESGGVMGDITWGTAFRLAGPIAKPANNKRRTITFYCDGTGWVETSRATADI